MTNASSRTDDEFVIKRLDECTFRQAVELWNTGFSEYYSDMSLTIETFVPRLGRLSIRPELSVAAFSSDGQPAGFVLLAFKTVNGIKVAWNGGTGVNPVFRGKGLAKRIMNEAASILKSERVARAFLEVVQKNTGAVKAYESAGFRIVDGLIGSRRTGVLPSAIAGGQMPSGYRLEIVSPSVIGKLPYYRNDAAWTSQWYNKANGEGLLLLNEADQPIAYSLLSRRVDDSGKTTAITVFQCEVDPSIGDSGEIRQLALAASFGPAELDCRREANNLSTADPITEQWLEEAGFETIYTQYLMAADYSVEEQ